MPSPDPSSAARRPRFVLAVVASRDGFIARARNHPPAAWASPEEQTLFLAEVEAADWAIMGRNTHEAADKPERRRIVFSSAAGAGEWRRPTQLWLDPGPLTPAALAARVAPVRPLRRGLILGGTAVHDWFHDAGAIDRISLTIEPVAFGNGLPMLSAQTERDPEAAWRAAGYRTVAERALNDRGTRLLTLAPERR
ncbi:hypothetical protein GE300_15995 [Rhodobacteraceae bacterium 2CG4]|uniref:Uncharacterized protein n=1 Tax=Halovulum marinum TaxID=2662447 RepID=A0A6L5Z4Z4_9RHOB|nr:dihydrofolate reductase family protein [Halovulum marinum]MSU91092.1 hypothetical protein [Halovulum marinum]